MQQLNGIGRMLKQALHCHKARSDCLLRILLALFSVKTVNLAELAVGFSGQQQISSRYRRIQRFFAQFNFDYVWLARWLFSWFFKDQQVYVCIDRTNWYWGKAKLNIFMLSVAYEGLAIPLFWTLLPKAGNTHVAEQQRLLQRFINTFGSNCIAGVLGDREFGSGDLFSWLANQRIPFYIRIKDNSKVCIGKKRLFTVVNLFRHLPCKQQQVFGMNVWIYGQLVYLTGARSARGELMVIATNQPVKNAIAVYLRRWEIENLFQGLKGRGFRLEETHLTQLARLEKLVALLAIGFCWAHKIGEWRATIKPIYFKRFKPQIRPQYTYFRYGLDYLRNAILQQCQPLLRQCLRLFLPPPGIAI